MPVNHGSVRSQATVSAPSSTSPANAPTSPVEPKVPRQLWMTTWKPRSAYGRANSSPNRPARPYGLRTRTVPRGTPAGT